MSILNDGYHIVNNITKSIYIGLVNKISKLTNLDVQR